MKRIIDLLICITAVFVLVLPVFAEEGALYTNPDTGYSVYIRDDADLLSDEEEAKLAEDMKPVTEFGNAVFTPHIPVDVGLVCQHHFGNGCGPTTSAHDCYPS